MMQYDNNGQVINIHCCGGMPSTPTTTTNLVTNGFGSPIVLGIAPIAGSLYINDSDATVWAVANGVWHQEV